MLKRASASVRHATASCRTVPALDSSSPFPPAEARSLHKLRWAKQNFDKVPWTCDRKAKEVPEMRKLYGNHLLDKAGELSGSQHDGPNSSNTRNKYELS